jgi:hypothetical protein
VFNGNIWQIAPMIDAQSRWGIARVAPCHLTSGFAGPGFCIVAEIKSGAMTAPVLGLNQAVQTGRKGSLPIFSPAKTTR